MSEIFKLVGYHIPPTAVSTPDKREITCSKLNIPNMYVQRNQAGFNPTLYSTVMDDAGIKKQKLYPKNIFERESYLDNILNNLTANDIKLLIKYLEEYSQMNKFSRIFPTSKTHEYFQFFDYLPYYDKLLDAFEERFGNNIEAGIAFVEEHCRKNVHN